MSNCSLPDRINGKLPRYTSIGCYPLLYLTDQSAVLCASCATCVADDINAFGDDETIVAVDVNWEDPDMYCEECNERIESAYAETE